MIAGVVGLGNCKVQLDRLDFTQWGQIVCVSLFISSQHNG